MLSELLNHVGKEYVPMIQNSLNSTKKSMKIGSNLLRPMHKIDVQFIMKKCCQQIRKFMFDKLHDCKSICIIADECSERASQEYCSVSARYVMENL